METPRFGICGGIKTFTVCWQGKLHTTLRSGFPQKSRSSCQGNSVLERIVKRGAVCMARPPNSTATPAAARRTRAPPCRTRPAPPAARRGAGGPPPPPSTPRGPPRSTSSSCCQAGTSVLQPIHIGGGESNFDLHHSCQATTAEANGIIDVPLICTKTKINKKPSRKLIAACAPLLILPENKTQTRVYYYFLGMLLETTVYS